MSQRMTETHALEYLKHLLYEVVGVDAGWELFRVVFFDMFLRVSSPVGGVATEHTVEWLVGMEPHVRVQVGLKVRLVTTVHTFELP